MKKALKTVELLVLQCFFFCKRGTQHSQQSHSQRVHKIISTQRLTVLIIGAIVQLEQRKRDKESEI